MFTLCLLIRFIYRFWGIHYDDNIDFGIILIGYTIIFVLILDANQEMQVVEDNLQYKLNHPNWNERFILSGDVNTKVFPH